MIHVLLIRVNLDAYTSLINSPIAAAFFWTGLTIVLVVGGILMWKLGHPKRS